MLLSRRKLIVGAASLLAAPAIVRAGSLMPVKALPLDWIAGEVELAEWRVISPEQLWFRYVVEFNAETKRFEFVPSPLAQAA